MERVNAAGRVFLSHTKLDGRLVVEDVKSAITAKAAAYRIKRHLMLAVHGIEVQEVR